MYQIRIEFTFDSGHRLLDYNGKCAYPHGHTYRAEVFLESRSLDRLGLVYDFTDLKDRIKTWVDENWDHAFLLNSMDNELIAGLGGAALVRLYKFQEENRAPSKCTLAPAAWATSATLLVSSGVNTPPLHRL